MRYEFICFNNFDSIFISRFQIEYLDKLDHQQTSKNSNLKGYLYIFIIQKMSEEPYNYLAIENGVNIIDCTSQVPNCPAKNMLSTDRKVFK